MMHRFGFNINSNSYSKTDIMQFCYRHPATVQLIMNNPALAQKVHDQANGETIVISRNNWPDDTFVIDAKTLLNKWDEERRHYPDIYQYYPNEPLPSTDAELKQLLRSLVGMMRTMREMKIKAVLGNFAWGKVLHWEDVEAGLWDEFILEASLWTNEGWGFIGGHDYSWGVVPLGCNARNPYDMLVPELVQLESWPTAHEVRNSHRNNWLMLRWMMLVERADQLGVPMFQMIVTETLVDRMPNLEKDVEIDGETRQGIIKMFDQSHGETRGPLSQRNLYNFWFPDRLPEEVYMLFIKWMDAVYPPYVRGFTQFALNRDWEDFNLGEWPEVLELLAAYDPEPQHYVDFDNSLSIRIAPRDDLRIHVRSVPNIKGKIIGNIYPYVWTDITVYDFNTSIGSDEYRPIEWGNSVGFVAFKYLNWEEIETIAEPDPIPSPVTIEQHDPEDIAEILEAYERLGDEIADLTEDTD